MLEYFVKGGIVMYPILFCSIVSIAIIIERLIFFSSMRFNNVLLQKIVELLKNRDLDKAQKLVEKFSYPLKLIISEGIKNYYSPNLVEHLQDVSEQQIPRLERYLPILAAIASVSTLLGFTGTVIGMIKAFESIAQAGYASPQVVAKGISEALITTAAGLLVAIPTVIFYHYFNYRVNRWVHLMEHCVQEIVNSTKFR